MKQFFQDGTGAFSAMRLVTNVTAILFFVTWIVELISTGSFKPSWELTSFVSSVVLGKGIQSFAENQSAIN